MKTFNTHSKSGLFLTEMILSLLVLSLTAAACTRIFASARTCRREAREWNHIQELTISAGEILEGSDGSTAAFLELLPGGNDTGTELLYTFDSQWQLCSADKASYQFLITPDVSSGEKKAALKFLDAQENTIYEQTICFPLLTSKKEVSE